MARVYFGGGTYREPTALSRLRVGVLPTVTPNPTNRVAVIGSSEGGLPQTLYTFNSYQDAADVLRSGDSLKAIRSIFSPSNALPGAGQVYFIRGDQATAAAKTFNDATTGAAFTVTTVDKGVHTNGFFVGVAAGSVDSAKRVITVKVPGLSKDSGTDGVTSTASSKYYFESATVDFSGAQTGDVIVVRNAGATTVNHYTIKAVVSSTKVEINETVTGATGLIWVWTKYTTTVSPELAVTGVTGALNQNLVNWINATFSGVLTAVVGAGTTIAAAASGPLTGGTVTAMTLGDIEDALEILRTQQVAHLYVARACGTGGGELSFAGALTGHLLNDAEFPGIAYIGSAADKTVDDAITYAQALNSPRLVYCFQTAIDTAEDGQTTEEIPGYLLAAKVAGLAAGLEAQTPLTRKSIAILGLKALPNAVKLDRVTREKLLDAGVLHVMPDSTGAFVINQGLNTLQSNDALWDAASNASSEISLMRITDAILSDLQTSAQSFIGGSSSTMSRPVVMHFVNSYLTSKIGTMLQSFQGITVTQVQDKWYVEFGITPTYPVNFVLITGTVVG